MAPPGCPNRYQRPGDYSFVTAFGKMKAAADAVAAGKKGAGLPAAFDEVCKHTHPVLHHFFLESFRNPAEWFERRLSYTRSTAANSMAGESCNATDGR